jgi:hypothetical protein
MQVDSERPNSYESGDKDASQRSPKARPYWPGFLRVSQWKTRDPSFRLFSFLSAMIKPHQPSKDD